MTRRQANSTSISARSRRQAMRSRRPGFMAAPSTASRGLVSRWRILLQHPNEGWVLRAVHAFLLHKFGDVRSMTGVQIQDASAANLVTEFLRPEDGAWDTRNPNVFYFVTTDRFDSKKDGSGTQVARSRLHRLTFDGIRQPELGGRYDMLLDG